MPVDQNNLIWIDMEMTGLQPDSDRIIEIALLVTDAQLATVADVRQLDLPGPALPRALDAAARGLLPLPQPRRLDFEGAGAALEARGRQGLSQGKQARGARRHARVDRGAALLPAHGSSYLRWLSTQGKSGSEPDFL